jgi:hypothetical protein
MHAAGASPFAAGWAAGCCTTDRSGEVVRNNYENWSKVGEGGRGLAHYVPARARVAARVPQRPVVLPAQAFFLLTLIGALLKLFNVPAKFSAPFPA